MKNSFYLKFSSLIFTVMVIGGGLLFFTSASSVDQSNSQIISELSADLAEMTAELNTLKTYKSEDAILGEATLGEVALFGGNFAPRGWALCDGQLLPINSNQALFSILGTTYGGDGRTTFALPDLRGRVAVHPGNGPGLSSRRLGEKFGQESSTIAVTNGTAAAYSKGEKQTLVSGINDPVNVMQPSLGVNYIIALQGIFPSRN